MSTKDFGLLKGKTQFTANGTVQALMSIGKTMARRLESYKRLACSDLIKLAKILDPPFPSDTTSDSDLLRRYI